MVVVVKSLNEVVLLEDCGNVVGIHNETGLNSVSLGPC